jgi:hypothetical protein
MHYNIDYSEYKKNGLAKPKAQPKGSKAIYAFAQK